jgi:type I restriction enzyme S subunit
MATNQGCKGLIPHGNLHYKFLYYNLLSNVELLNNLGTGATFKELSGGKLKEVAIPLPPLEEQKRIVAILDEAFEGLDRAAANAKKNLANARELFDSHLNAVFTQEGEGWIEKPLGDLVKIKHGFAFKSEYFTSSGDYVLLTPGNFFEKGGYRDRGQKQKYYAGPLPDGYILEEGDMLLAMTEQAPGLLGSPLIVPVANRFLHNQRLGLIQVKEGAAWCGKFFAHLFNSSKFRSRVHSDASGVKVRHSSPEKICAVTVSFPTSLPVQVSIAERLNDLRDETERLQELYVEKSAAVASLKQSILQKAFAGELTTAMDLAA